MTNNNTTIEKDVTEKPFANTNIRSYVPITLDLEYLNYESWRDLFEAYYISFGFNHHLTNSPPTKPSTDWSKLESLIKICLYGTIKKYLIQMIFKKGMTVYNI